MPTTSAHRAGSGPARRRRRAPLAAAAVTLLALAAAGCGDGGTSNTASQSSIPPGSTAPAGTSAPSAPQPSATSGPPQTAASAAPTSASARAASDRCTVTDLRMRLGTGDPGAGQVYYPLRFTNISGHACVLNGFPGVSLLRGDGSTIGKPAGREGSKGAAVNLAPGATVQSDLHTLNRGIKGDSCWRTPTLLKAYPPGSKDSMTLSTSSPRVCGDTFEVGAVHH